MAPEKPKNDPHMLKIPKIFDLYHQTLRLKFLYHGSTIYLIRTFLSCTAQLVVSVPHFQNFMQNIVGILDS